MEKNKLIYFMGFLVLLVPSISAVIISEIMYAPTQSEYYNEWIEIYNDGDSDIDLTNWNLCGNNLLGGYIDNADSQLKLNTTMILSAADYAIITDGGSGTEVYSNFAVDSNSIALHSSSSTLCTGLNNAGDTITLEDGSGNLIDSVIYDPNSGGNNDGNSLQLCSNSWAGEIPTPGSSNSCQSSSGGSTQNTQTSNDTSSETGSQTSPSENTQEEGINENNVSNTSSQTGSGYTVKDSKKEETNKEPEIIILNINSDTKDIKTEENNKKLDKNDYIKYGLILFGLLLVLLFLLKEKIFKKEYKNEFKIK